MTSKVDQQRFLEVPHIVYKDDRNWVAPLRSSVASHFKPDNPFLSYGKLQQFVALRDRQPVGRIVAAINDRLIEREGERIGLFGFFECIDDSEIAQALLGSAEAWLKAQHIVKVRGPIDLSTHNNCLFLAEGFDSPPLVMMPYNPPYYLRFMEEGEWHQAKDAFAYDLPLNQPLPESYERAYRVACKSGVTFRSIHTQGQEFQADCRGLYDLFTRAFANNWSSTPRTEAEFLEEAKALQSLVDPAIFPIAEYEGEMVGFFMALPDYNVALKPVNGRLNWLGVLKFLWYRRQIHAARVIAVCALPTMQRKMVAPALIYLGHRNGTHQGRTYERAELSWVYEDNLPSRKIIEATGATIHKTYRIYEKGLAP
ncbi:hypothetical protein [Lyngbya confervoides]|uniref:N-acetyltransferase domain-containing protein n=1 Tax=Lyngbya confervoides BDU141951 TaxID=1574623 RepID=A0ABD4T9X8_9CYAN|nr:hypothetical protein [Lyngbya confervoides]MCM1985204.1 hypothetical protein [Lyngbya confervoides BDU141951]